MANVEDGDDEPILAFRQKVFHASAESVEWYTAPICFLQDGRYVHDRTGVLLQIGDLNFLITAAHDFYRFVEAGMPAFITMPEKGVNPVFINDEQAYSTRDPREDIAVIKLRDG